MGFECKELEDQSVVIEANFVGNDAQSFLLCIQKALATKKLDITVDVLKKPHVLNEIIAALESLQKVLLKQGKSVHLRGLDMNTSDELLRRLVTAGLIIETETRSVQNPAVSALPAPEQMAERLRSIRETLAQVLTQKRKLEKERKFYEERLQLLRAGVETKKVDEEKLQKLARMEADLSKFSDESFELFRTLQEAEGSAQKAEAEYETLVKDLKNEDKLRREPFEKKIEELLKKQQSVQADYFRKSEDRKNRLALKDPKAKPS